MTKYIDDTERQLESDMQNNITRKFVADKAKPTCPSCGKYTDKKTSPQCLGHGGGGGSHNNSAESADKIGQDGATVLSKSPTQVGTGNSVVGSNITLTSQFKLNNPKFNSEVISELLSKKLLVIDNDTEKGILTIKLQFAANSLSPEQRDELKKFVNVVLNELNEFKKENGLSANCYEIKKDKGENILLLRITIPTPTLYDAFIQRLDGKNLLPIQNIMQQKNKKIAYPEGENHFKSTPFSTKPTPKNKRIIEEESQKIGEKKISIRPRSPLDGLKPKGWNKDNMLISLKSR